MCVSTDSTLDLRILLNKGWMTRVVTHPTSV